MNNFNFIAPFYDSLVRVVFGSALLRAQSAFFSEVQPTDRVLILGGGTGKILETLPACEKVFFLDKSIRMILKAKKRKHNLHVEFTHADFLSHLFSEKVDVIICPFFLDCFHKDHLEQVLCQIRGRLTPGGKLLITDFQSTGHRRHKYLLSVMHLFFRLFTRLESSSLQDIDSAILQAGFQKKDAESFLDGLVFSGVYQV